MGFFFFIIPSLFCCVKHVLNIQEVKGGAEILVNYEYAFDEAPPWSVHTVLCILQQGWRQSANNLFSFFVFGLIILYEGDQGLLPELIISTTNFRHYFKKPIIVEKVIQIEEKNIKCALFSIPCNFSIFGFLTKSRIQIRI